ncbi:GH36-type glycosyl hydrolase domain-containing protein [Martelella endophytica]|uniref:Glycosyltransferase 36 n=1 Tax=Martelella endophytica TaxID=1486262 RepID=A0A0D5LMX6_MAREN|nr:hypothetical protein [Martelella endophytica]AJY45481.1 hypothetical protein TM49_06880 [Martelella endophytica]
MTAFIDNGTRFRLTDPTIAPNAAGYLWNKKMMVQVNCRGYAVAQYMDPEPRKYAHVPTIAGQTFMQPEQGYFTHHPGRFFYVRDNEAGTLFSAPYEPVRAGADTYAFEPGLSDVRWVVEKDGIRIETTLRLPVDDVLELWSVSITNVSGRARDISLVPYFPVGYMSWMNMGGHFDAGLNAIVCTSVTPYQKVEQYFKNRHLKDITFLSADRKPDHFEICQQAFEGEGGLHNPSALQDRADLADGDAIYEVPAAIMQWNLKLEAGATDKLRLVFGPAKDEAEIARLKRDYLDTDEAALTRAYDDYIADGAGSLRIKTPDPEFDTFVNNWLPRQVFYHGDTNRLTTDPQTRNYLQDALGMTFIHPEKTREAILRSVSQQFASGKMPDGILLSEEAELKYINQVPHTDHGVWLAVAMEVYLDETGDRAILSEMAGFADSDEQASVADHITRALDFLAGAVDHRGLPFIEQGDWCDPMNMVGYKGKGVSGWLAEASSYAMTVWAGICRASGDEATAERLEAEAKSLNERINTFFWKEDRYGRGITDDDVLFGIGSDKEGRIFLNAQSWALLSGAADEDRKQKLLAAISGELDTPYGTMMFAPAYTAMRDDVGRVTQKWPGSAENGAVYNHAAAFYAAALYHRNEGERAFSVLRRMLTGSNEADIARRGQIPLYVPNYYRGAYYQFPRTAGRSSNLFNTGTASWYYRLVIERLFGLKGDGEGVVIAPQIPAEWPSCSFTRTFRGAHFEVSFERDPALKGRTIEVDGALIDGNRLASVEAGHTYRVVVREGAAKG